MVALASLILAPSAKPIANLPFELYGNHILLGARLNGRPVTAFLDTGAGGCVVDAAAVRRVGASHRADQDYHAEDAGGGAVAVQAVEGLALSLAGGAIRQPVYAAIDLARLDQAAGRPIDAILGADFLARYRVEIDYAAGRVRLFDPRAPFRPAGANAVPVTLLDGLPVVRGRVMVPGSEPKGVTMLLDTGSGSTFDVTSPAVARLGLDRSYASVPDAVTGLGAGGETRGKGVRLPWVEIGAVRLARPTADLSTDKGGVNGPQAAYDVLVGGAVLRRFTLTLDYSHRRVYFRPNARLAEAFVGDRTGLGLTPTPDGYRVVRLVPGSPAGEAGIVAGDIVVRIEGKPPVSPEAVRNRLSHAVGALRLTVRHEGREREVLMKTRELLP